MHFGLIFLKLPEATTCGLEEKNCLETCQAGPRGQKEKWGVPGCSQDQSGLRRLGSHSLGF